MGFFLCPRFSSRAGLSVSFRAVCSLLRALLPGCSSPCASFFDALSYLLPSSGFHSSAPGASSPVDPVLSEKRPFMRSPGRPSPGRHFQCSVFSFGLLSFALGPVPPEVPAVGAVAVPSRSSPDDPLRAYLLSCLPTFRCRLASSSGRPSFSFGLFVPFYPLLALIVFLQLAFLWLKPHFPG